MFLDNVEKRFTVGVGPGGGVLERVGRVTVNTTFFALYFIEPKKDIDRHVNNNNNNNFISSR